jgi:hypothetical protein
LSKTQTTFFSLAEELEESGTMKCVYRNTKHNFSFCEANSLYESMSAAVSVLFLVAMSFNVPKNIPTETNKLKTVTR